ncbi:uncharacterized protein G2W53_037847 [Senna tora]|uniref:Uncharacterized protein n=1 Tax=Senna tora TaxID=362788 RepID=A0A834W4P3_9FABA|nr:uncharacterized protein G2W53_037847 [Senna tora]
MAQRQIILWDRHKGFPTSGSIP